MPLVKPKVSISKVELREKSTLTLGKKITYISILESKKAKIEAAFPKPQAETRQRRMKYAQHVELWVTTWCFSVLEEN